MNYVVVVSFLFLSIHLVTAPPPRRTDQKEVKDEKHEKEEVEDFGLEYNRYLEEVIELLESDPEFKRKLVDAHEADIRSGKIAQELEFVDHKVRTKLDEVKRQELERLRHLAQKQFELNNGIDTEHMKISSEHLDHENPHTFEMEDLKKLIAKVSADLNKADEKRRQEFKEYEMQKEFEKQEKLKHLQGSEKEAFEKQLQENETKHKQHEPLHHPGSKQQLEEVWEKQDHMENQDFDPKVFFQLHDLDGNGVWDQNEVKTLFLKELDKMYEQGAPEDDMRERAEEMERMREHVFSEADKNKDGLISYDEFLDKTRQPDFEKDPGWETVDQKPAYTYEEYKEFERRRQEEVQRLIQQGLIPPQPVYHDYGYLPQQPGYGHPNEQYHQQHMQGYHPQMGQGHPNQQGYNQNQFNPNYPNVGHHNPGGHVNYQQQQQHFQPNYQQQGQHNYPQQHQPQGQDHQQQQQHHNVNNQQQEQYQPKTQQQQQYQPNSHHQQQQYQPNDHHQQQQQYQDHHQQQQQYQPNDHHQQQQQYQPNDHHQQQQQQYQSNDHHQQQQQYQPSNHQQQQQYQPNDHHQQQQQYHVDNQNQKDHKADSHQNVNHGQPSQNAPHASQEHSNNLDHGQLNQHNQQHQQPSQADVKPAENYDSHPNSVKTGSFQKAEGNLPHKEAKNAPQPPSNHL